MKFSYERDRKQISSNKTEIFLIFYTSEWSDTSGLQSSEKLVVFLH